VFKTHGAYRVLHKNRFPEHAVCRHKAEENITPPAVIRNKIAEFEQMELKRRGLALHTKKIGFI
jgi:hypothetical protein